MNNLEELNPLCSLGNSKEKQRNAAGIIPEVAKLILPQNILQEESLNKYANNTLKAQPAEAQESKENVTFTRINVDFFEKAKTPNPRSTKTANESINPLRIILVL